MTPEAGIEPGGPDRKRWTLALRLVLLLGSIGVALLAAEAALRAYFYSKGIGRNDVSRLLEESGEGKPRELHGGTGLYGLVKASDYPDAIYELRPNQSGLFVGRHVEINSLGLRGHEVTLEKPPGTYRIAGIGDSHMFGWGVAQDETYLARLETMLNEAAPPGRRFETLNFAAPGYNTVMEVSIFEHKVLRFDPDLVVIHFIGNDIFPPKFLEPTRSWNPDDWYLTEILRATVGRPESPDERKTANQRRYRNAQLDRLTGSEPARAALNRLADLCQKRHLPVIFLVLGAKGGPRDWALPRATRLGFHVVEAGATFVALLKANGIEPSERNFRRFFTGDSSHPNAMGHLAYAQALIAELVALGVAPPSADSIGTESVSDSEAQTSALIESP